MRGHILNGQRVEIRLILTDQTVDLKSGTIDLLRKSIQTAFDA